MKQYDNLPRFDTSTLFEITENFYREIKLSSEGKKTSLPFIINPLKSKARPLNKARVQAMAIGGSVFKSAEATFNDSQILLSNFKTLQQPKFSTRDIFTEFIYQNLDENIEVLTVNFAYPVEPILRDGKSEGLLKTGTKEQDFDGLIDKPVGEIIENYIKQKSGRVVDVYIANDAVCLLLSGMDKAARNCLAGGIVGTGLNFSFFLNDSEIVNLESGNFDKFPRSKQAMLLDSTSSAPGAGLLEKEVSGRYLFELYNLTAEDAEPKIDRIKSTEEMSTIAKDEQHPGSEIARLIFEKSAMLTAAQIAGICRYKNTGMSFVMEGSLFWKGYKYKEQVTDFCTQLNPGFSIDFIGVEDSSLRGAAMLAII